MSSGQGSAFPLAAEREERGEPERDGVGTPVGRAGPGRAAPPLPSPPTGQAAVRPRACPLVRHSRAGDRLTEEPQRPALTQQPGRACCCRRLRRAPVPAHRPPRLKEQCGGVGPVRRAAVGSRPRPAGVRGAPRGGPAEVTGSIPRGASSPSRWSLCVQAGATSMWASCCGLLNEVMGTGAVRGQQAGFGGGAGPFRFAPNTDFSAYPSPAAAGTNIVCKACGLSFSVFRKKHVCCDCKKDFCSVCSVSQENLRRCSTCHLLQETAFQRPQLMRLKVKDLRQYLILRNIPTDTCREKEDLVDLVLCHHGLGSEEEMDASSLHSSRSQTSGFFTHPFSMSVSVSSQGELANRSGSTGNGTPLRGQTETSSVNNEEEESPEEQTPGLSRKRARASLSDISSLEDIEGLSVRQLKEILACNFVNYSGCCEKWELVEKVSRLYRESEENHKTQGEKMQLADDDDNLCRICMDAIIDCVLLECGHMVTCTKCGKRMSECPICRQYVVRAVHVFKS